MTAGVGGLRGGATMPPLGAGEVKLVFWALRWNEKGEHSQNI